MRHIRMWAAGIMVAAVVLMGAECDELYYAEGFGDGYYYWDGGITSGYSREGNNSMYSNWYTDTTISSDGDAGYISFGDGTSYSWE